MERKFFEFFLKNLVSVAARRVVGVMLPSCFRGVRKCIGPGKKTYDNEVSVLIM